MEKIYKVNTKESQMKLKLSKKIKGLGKIKRPEAFTLVELMIVVAVIGVIAGIVLAAAGGVQKKAARDQTRTEIKSLMVGLERFRSDLGYYPTNNGTPTSTGLFVNLTNYATFKTNQVTTNQILDPYGYPYWYRLVPAGQASGSGATSMMDFTPEIWSVGPNGRSGLTNASPNANDPFNRDDITSWQ